MLVNLESNLAAWRRQGGSRRRLRRWSVNIRALVRIAGGAYPCTVVDLSPAGAKLQLDEPRQVSIGGRLVLELEDFGPVAAEARYSAGETLGLMFLHGDDGEVRLARYLVARRPQRRSPRRKLGAHAVLTPRRSQSDCVVDDISRGGASILLDDAARFADGDEVLLTIAGFGDIVATVRRVDAQRIGLEFQRPLDGDFPE